MESKKKYIKIKAKTKLLKTVRNVNKLMYSIEPDDRKPMANRKKKRRKILWKRKYFSLVIIMSQ